MKSRVNSDFRKAFEALPEQIKKRAKQALKRFLKNPNHPGLQFKQVNAARNLYSVRINKSYRALGIHTNDDILWIWIGNHDEYENLIG